MSKRFSLLLGVAALALSAMIAYGQDTTATKTKVVANPDGSYSVIEYPVGKEVMVNLVPAASIPGKGMVHVMRTDKGSHIVFDVNGVPTTVTSYYAYAVDPSGSATLLGPVTFTNGVGKAEFDTPLNQFMVVLSPTEGLTTLDPTTAVMFRSDVPAGYTIVPRKVSGDTKAVAVATTTAPSGYNVPVLNVPSFGDKSRELMLKFGGDLNGLEGKATLTAKKGAATKVTMKFDDMNKVPKGKIFTLWASSPDGQYTKIGQVLNSGKKDEAEIRSEITLPDFGLFMTVEDAAVTVPTSTIYAPFTVVTVSPAP
jgi:hypothetical protein